MSTTDKTKSKLLDSMRMSKEGVSETTPQETKGSAAKPATTKKATTKKAAAKKTSAKKPVSMGKAKAKAKAKTVVEENYTSSVTPTGDTYQSKGRIWPD